MNEETTSAALVSAYVTEHIAVLHTVVHGVGGEPVCASRQWAALPLALCLRVVSAVSYGTATSAVVLDVPRRVQVRLPVKVATVLVVPVCQRAKWWGGLAGFVGAVDREREGGGVWQRRARVLKETRDGTEGMEAFVLRTKR